MTNSTGGRRAAWTRALLLGTVLSGAVISAPLNGAKADTQDDINALKAENAELREMVKTLSQDVQILKNSVQQTNEAVQAAATPKAPEKMVQSGRSGVQLTVSGQANRMAFYADNGDEAQLFNADNDFSSTRVNFTGKGKITDDLTAGATIEVQIESNSSADVTIPSERAAARGTGFNERKLEVFFDSESLGMLSLGQGSTASDGIAEIDLSGTQVISGSGFDALGASIEYLTSGTNAPSGFAVGDLINNQDGLSRDDRMRYDSPSLAGFVASTSWVDADTWDVALRYAGEFSGWEGQAGIGYWDASARSTGFTGIGGSAAIRAPFGTSLQGAYTSLDFDSLNRDDTGFWYVKLGQDFDVIEFGTTGISIDYSEAEDESANGTQASFWSIALVQAIKKAATEIYFNVGQYSGEVPGAGSTTVDLEDITIAGVGARVRF